MNYASVQTKFRIGRIKYFLALSRTPHALLDLATPALSAVLWLGGFPDFRTIGLGLLTAFAGYMSVYALNDVMDYRGDVLKIRRRVTVTRHITSDLDSFLLPHPMAHGNLTTREGFFWMLGWGFLALLGSYLLNPVCTLIFVSACLLEIFYCRLLQVTYLRGIVSGIVKNSGGIAAVYAVDPHPAAIFLLFLFLWFFLWEIGGQNIPNDWMDLEEDRELQAQTIPARFGARGSVVTISLSLGMTVVLSIAMYWISRAPLGLFYPAGSLLAGVSLLLLPAYRAGKNKSPQDISSLFNRASYYPAILLLVTLMSRL